jgi:hypothetical protein
MIKATSIITVTILILLIVLVYKIKVNYDDNFINTFGEVGPLGKMMITENNDGTGNLNQHPMTFSQQIYPKNPYTIGQLCNGDIDCSAAARCVNGMCQLN